MCDTANDIEWIAGFVGQAGCGEIPFLSGACSFRWRERGGF